MADDPPTCLTEEQVGIRVFTTTSKPFRAATKQRYSDFLVNEKQRDGTTVRLNQLAHKPTTTTQEHDQAETLDPRDHLDELAQFFGQSQTAAILKLHSLAEEQLLRQKANRRRKRLRVEPQPAGDSASAASSGAHQAEKEPSEVTTPASGLRRVGLEAPLLDANAPAVGAPDASEVLALDASSEALLREGLLLAVEEDKELRKSVHAAVRRFLPALTSTTEDDASRGKCIRLLSTAVGAGASSGKGGRGRGGGRGSGGRGRQQQHEWPEEAAGKKYLEFTLYKENHDTIDALNRLSRSLGVRPNTFSYAGTKDRRAVTAQRVSAYRVSASRLGQLMCRRPYGDSILVGDMTYELEPLRLGMHGGNYFTLTLRDLRPEDPADDVAVVAASATSELFARGFINYFGLQRFGNNPGAPTHEVGAAILRSDYSAAMRLLLDPGPLCSAELRDALASFERTGDTAAALAALHPNYNSTERTLLKSLSEQPTNFMGAIMKLPRNLRTIYVHALQSSSFNHAASERVRLYGCEKVVAGDLVSMDSATPAQASSAAQAGEAGPRKPADGIAYDEDEALTAPADERLSSLQTPHIVSEEEAAEGKYTIDDVVLPVPGTDVIYPLNDVAAEYDRHLATHGLVRGSFAHHVRQFRLRGDYRRLLQRPSDLEWRIERYDDPTEPLVQTDIARLRGEPPRPCKASGERTALIICFTLPASSYATMLIRELTKQKTDKAHQIALNVTGGADDAAAAIVARRSDGGALTTEGASEG